jgi:hypothetical protein
MGNKFGRLSQVLQCLLKGDRLRDLLLHHPLPGLREQRNKKS